MDKLSVQAVHGPKADVQAIRSMTTAELVEKFIGGGKDRGLAGLEIGRRKANRSIGKSNGS